MDTDAPRMAVQIVTWNSAQTLDSCLESVFSQTDRRFEAVLVDNASQDDSADRATAWLRRGLPGKLLRQDVNRGFCGGHNVAFRASAAELVLFLNPDARLPPSFVSTAIGAADRLPKEIGTIAPRILRPGGRIDSAGLFIDRCRRARDRGQGRPATEFEAEEDVFGCTGAAALHRRAMLEDVATDGAPLDERIFAYYDDADLSWRALLFGWRCRYVPALIVEHDRAGRNALRARGGGRRADQLLMIRNRYLVMARNERPAEVVAALPWLVSYEIARLAYLSFTRPWALRAYLQAARELPGVWRSRRRTMLAVAERSPRQPRRLVPFRP